MTTEGSIGLKLFEEVLLETTTTIVTFNSVLIADNCSIHHVEEISAVLEDAQVIAHYLPPYSPDYNPIEVFAKVKLMLKAME